MSKIKCIMSANIISLVISGLIGYEIIEHSEFLKGIGLGIALFVSGFLLWWWFLYSLFNKKYRTETPKEDAYISIIASISSLILMYTSNLLAADVGWELGWLPHPIQLILVLLCIMAYIAVFAIFLVYGLSE